MKPAEIDIGAMSARALGDEIVSAQLFGGAYAEDARIHRLFTAMRAHGKPVKAEPDNTRPFWALTRHADIMQVSTDQDSFISSRRLTLMSRLQEAAAFKGAERYGKVLRTLIHMDEPDHKQYRAVTQPWFSGAAARQQQAVLDALSIEYMAKLTAAATGVESAVGSVVDGAVDNQGRRSGSIDFAAEIATLYPLRVIMAILGVPLEDLPLMHRLTKVLAAPQDPDFGSDVEAGVTLFDSIPEFTEYFLKMMEDRRKHPRDDLASVIANGTINGAAVNGKAGKPGPMGELETVSYYITMPVAGHDTTAAAMAGGCLALAQRPDQWARLRAQPELMKSAADEMIRWVTPIKYFMRSATRDIEVGGATIKKGDGVCMIYLAGNRDEAVFDAPFEFRINRHPNRHLAFGFGAHVCLGMALSRLELMAWFGEMSRQVETLEMAGPVRPVETNFLGGFKNVPIRYTLAREGGAAPALHEAA